MNGWHQSTIRSRGTNWNILRGMHFGFFSGYHQITHSRFSNIPSKLFLIPEQPLLTQANQVYDFKLPNLSPGKTYNVRIRAAFVSKTGIVTQYTWPKNMVNVNLW